MEFKRIFTQEEIDTFNYAILDIEKWINGMIDGKLNNCKKRKELEIFRTGTYQNRVQGENANGN